MEKLMEKFQDKALKKFLSQEEIALVKSAKTAAGFWAVKEACSKALGTGIGAECSFHDIKIYKNNKGAPQLALSKRVVEKFALTEAALSISHDGEYAIGVVTLQSTTTNKIEKF